MRFGRVGLSVMAAMALTCSTPIDTARRHPPHFPVMGCRIYCEHGRQTIYKRQHLCPGNRWFEDLTIKGETATQYITSQGTYEKVDIELVRCEVYIHQVVNDRSAEQRGQHPGEDPFGHPTNP